jgi:hypothetical protein
MKLEINSTVDLDDLRFKLQSQLTNRELVNFALSLGYNLDSDTEFFASLKKKINKLRID